MKAYLKDKNSNKEFQIDNEVTLGSLSHLCEIVYNDLAPVHIKIEREGNDFYLTDLRSPGTKVNDVLIPSEEKVKLNNNDLITIGNNVLTFEKQEPTLFSPEELSELNKLFNTSSINSQDKIISLLLDKIEFIYQKNNNGSYFKSEQFLNKNQLQTLETFNAVKKSYELKLKMFNEKEHDKKNKTVKIQSKPPLTNPPKISSQNKIYLSNGQKLILKPTSIFDKQLEINAFPFKIGHDSDMDLVLNKRGVSRNHAVIEFDGNNFLVKDQNSTNGTYVNNQAINTAILNPGDKVSFYTVTYKVIIL